VDIRLSNTTAFAIQSDHTGEAHKEVEEEQNKKQFQLQNTKYLSEIEEELKSWWSH